MNQEQLFDVPLGPESSGEVPDQDKGKGGGTKKDDQQLGVPSDVYEVRSPVEGLWACWS